MVVDLISVTAKLSLDVTPKSCKLLICFIFIVNDVDGVKLYRSYGFAFGSCKPLITKKNKRLLHAF